MTQMFQNFDDKSEGDQGAARLALLRAAMRDAGVDAFIIPLADAHQGEYVAECDARLAWLTGFTGSAGFAVVLADKAVVFVDGRYRVQVRAQVDLAAYTPIDWPETELGDWIAQNLAQGVVRYDPWLHPHRDIAALRKAVPDLRVEPGENLVDAIWADRPARPDAAMRLHPTDLAGRDHRDKRAEIAADLRARDLSAAVMTLCDATCWLLNIRGSDIPRNPIVQAFSILHLEGKVDLFTDAPIPDEVRAHLGDAVHVHPRSALLDVASALTGRVLVDKNSAPMAVIDALADPVLGDDPCALPKARKNAVEIAGARAAHLRDGAAMVRFLHWLDGATGVSEVSAAQQLETLRRDTGALLDISFDTISGTGPNAALPHYRVNTDSDRPLRDGDLYLVDSGGQYADGTTDITRTVAIGTPSARHAAWYTRVLQGVIAIHQIRFPKGTTGSQIDVLARAPLWRAGLEFDHGTGHGVGSYLCVHEGPQRITKSATGVALEPGMILSNEPGCYVEGDFGIRLENLITVRAAAPLDSPDPRPWLEFENLTFVPFDRGLIDLGLITADDRAWIDAYHAEVWDKIGPLVDGAARDWLRAACAAL